MNTVSGPFTMMSLIDIVPQQRFQRAEAHHVVGQFLRELCLVACRELHSLLAGDLMDHRFQFGPQNIGRHLGDGARVELFHDLCTQAEPQPHVSRFRGDRCGTRLYGDLC